MDSDDEIEYEPETFVFESLALSITTVAYMPLTILMANREKEKEVSGQKLWCGSLCLISYFLQHKTIISPNTLVVELGAGTGVLSMICTKLLGAPLAIATDHDEKSLKHMTDDLQRNHIDNMKVERLDWFNPDVNVILERSSSDRVHERLVILAGDVLYKDILITPLFHTVAHIFDAFPTIAAEMLLCHVPRAGVTHAMVQAAAEKEGFNIKSLEKNDWCDNEVLQYCPQDDLQNAELYRITKNIL